MTEMVLARAGALWRGLRADPVWLTLAVAPPLLLLLDPARGGSVLAIGGRAFIGTAPFIALAVGLIAWLRAAGAEGAVAAAFRGREMRMIVVGALVGGIAPFCSCEVIPLVAALLAAGAPLSAVMAFWLSSPLMDPPQFVITAAALGVPFAAAKVALAVAIGLAGGFAMAGLQRTGALAEPLRQRAARSCGGCCGSAPVVVAGPPRWRFWTDPARRETFAEAARDQALFLVKWLALAYLLEGLLIVYVPAEAIAGVVGGDGIGAVVAGALVGMPAYVNGYAAPALVAGLMTQGMSAGAAMAFMLAGAVSCIPAMAAVWALVRAPVFALYVGLGLGGAILGGLAFGALGIG